MYRINCNTYLQTDYGENIIALCIKDRQIYFKGWRENAENYDLMFARRTDCFLLDKNQCKSNSLYEVIINSDDYNNCALVTAKHNTYQEKQKHLLSCLLSVNPNILIMSGTEFRQICDILCDGDYIIILDSISK